MFSGHQGSKWRDTTLSMLDRVVQGLNVAKDVCGIPPAEIALGVACVLLTTIKDTMSNKDDFIRLGLSCAEVCEVLKQGLEETGSDEISKTVVDGIDRLKATVTDIQAKIAEKHERTILSRAFHARADKDKIATWQQEFKTILEIFNTGLAVNTNAMIADIRRLIKEGTQIHKLDWRASIVLGELPPPAPKAFFGRDALIHELVTLAKKFQPIALIGPGGIGKTSIALTLLHHDRVKSRFRGNRRLVRCDKFTPSLSNFLARLSKAIGAGVENPEDLKSLRPFLSSNRLLIVLDGVESIFDPEGTDSQKILAVVDELCQFEETCVCVTSRITMVPQHCHRPKIPTLSMEAACDIFHRIHNGHGQSSSIEDLMQRVEFHPLSITLLATTASHNQWDHDRLTKEWTERRTQMYGKGLAASIALSLDSPTFRKLGPDAPDLLRAIAFFPQGINENHLDWLFPTFPDIQPTLDKFCTLSLTRRCHGWITMLAPIRDHLAPQDPTSSPLLCTIKDNYFARLSVDSFPEAPGVKEAQWIVSEDVNVEHLLNIFTSIDTTTVDVWEACGRFEAHLCWYKPRKTVLASKIEGLPDDHPSKPKCLSGVAELFGRVGNHAERKRLLTHSLTLLRERGDHSRVAWTLGVLSDANRCLGLHEEGIRQAREALEISEELGDTIRQLHSLTILATALCNDNQLDAAESAALRAINLATERGDYALSGVHRLLGLICDHKGLKKKATYHFETSLNIASDFNCQLQLFRTYFILALLFLAKGELDKANAHAGQAKLHGANFQYELGCGMGVQAIVWLRQHKLEDGRVEASCALQIFEGLGAMEEAKFCKSLLEVFDSSLEQTVIGVLHHLVIWGSHLSRIWVYNPNSVLFIPPSQ